MTGMISIFSNHNKLPDTIRKGVDTSPFTWSGLHVPASRNLRSSVGSEPNNSFSVKLGDVEDHVISLRVKSPLPDSIPQALKQL